MHNYIDEKDKQKNLDEINAEIEAELQNEVHNEETTKSNKAIFSVAGIIMLLILARLIYHIIHYFFI